MAVAHSHISDLKKKNLPKGKHPQIDALERPFSLTPIPHSASFAAAVLAILLLSVLHMMGREVSFLHVNRCSTKEETGTKKCVKLCSRS